MIDKSQRQLQIAEQIKRNIAEIFLQDHNLSMAGNYITVAQADISPDIKNAKIFVNVFGQGDKSKIIARLNSLSSYLRGELSRKVNIRHTPQLTFVLDDSSENAGKISKLIDQESKNFPK